MDGLWWGHQARLTPLGSHWAQLSLAHSVGGVRIRVPSKPLVHTALAAALRVPAPLCALLHSLADLTSSLLSRACHQATQVQHLYCLSECWDASRRTTGTAFVIFPLWAPWEWPTTSRKKYLQCCSSYRAALRPHSSPAWLASTCLHRNTSTLHLAAVLLPNELCFDFPHRAEQQSKGPT